jgi:hypothetical protein
MNEKKRLTATIMSYLFLSSGKQAQGARLSNSFRAPLHPQFLIDIACVELDRP